MILMPDPEVFELIQQSNPRDIDARANRPLFENLGRCGYQYVPSLAELGASSSTGL